MKRLELVAVLMMGTSLACVATEGGGGGSGLLGDGAINQSEAGLAEGGLGDGSANEGMDGALVDAAARDAGDAMSSEVDAATGNLCERTGGSARTVLCCADAPDFPNTCPGNVGPCGCGPSASEEIQSCDCTDGACFMPGLGCTGGTACTPGQDQTCNDNPAISSLHGTCLASGICKCDPSFVKSPASGRCI